MSKRIQFPKLQELALGLLALIPMVFTLAYMHQYGKPMPLIDQTVYPIAKIAANASQGIFNPQDFLWNLEGHPIAPSLLITALFGLFTDWNMQAEMYVNFALALMTYIALLFLVHKHHPQIFWWCAIPASVFIFNLHQDIMWIVGLYSMWFIPTLLMFLIAIVLQKPTLSGFVLAVIFASISSYSMASGILLWGVGFVLVLLLGFHWRFWLAWVVIGGVVVLSVLGLSWGAITSHDISDVANPNLIRIKFILGYFGNLFATKNLTTAIITGIIGLAVLTLNSIVTLKHQPRLAFTFGAMALYPIGTAVIASLTRPFWYLNGEYAAFNFQYRTSMGVFWAIASVIIVSSTWYLLQEKHRIRPYITLTTNLLVSVAGIAAFIVATFGTLHPSMGDWNYLYRLRELTPWCYVRFAYTQSPDEMNAIDACEVWGTGWLNIASANELALFRNQTPQTILPSYTDNTLVVLYEDDRWAAYNIQKWLLHDIPTEAVRIIYNEEVPLLEDAPPIQSEMLPSLADLPAPQDSFWLVYSEFQTPPQLELDGFDVIPFTHTTPEHLTFKLLRYERFDPANVINAPFGDDIKLISWTITPSPAACTEIVVRSFWTPTAPLADGYSATLTLDRVTGSTIWDFETVARTDRQLTLSPTEQWQEGERYLDERTLAIPCDLPPGEYRLRVGVYNYRDNKLLATDDTELGLFPLAEIRE